MRIQWLETQPRRQAVVVLAVALAFRAAFLIWNLSGWHAIPDGTMARSYFLRGYAIAAGYGYISAEGPAHVPLVALEERVRTEKIRVTPEIAGALAVSDVRAETLHPPGTALLIAGINRLFGTPADLPLQLIFLVIDSVTAVLVGWVALVALGRRIGFASGLAYALFPPSAYMAIAKLPTGIVAVFIAGSLACALQGVRRPGRGSWRWYAASGCVLGLGGYFRPDYALMPIFLGLALWAHSRRFWRSVGAAALMQAAVFAVLLPWAYRNHAIFDRWIFTSTSAGGTMINGLGAFRNPWGFGPLDEDRHQEAAAVGIDNAWSPEGDEYFRKVFLRSIREHPGGFVMSVIYRLPAAFATPYDFGFENPWRTRAFTELRREGQDRYSFFRENPGYVLLAYGDNLLSGLLSLFCLGCTLLMVRAERRHLGLVLVLLSPHLYSIAVHVTASHMQPYYLLPSMFCWLISVGYVLAGGRRASP
jgi:4-amino-4-deoxy-L-arabinose transferase-like glycosyltransferase